MHPHPGQIINSEILPQFNSQTELADKLGITKGQLHNILVGQRSVSSELALTLSDISGKPASFWMHAQAMFNVTHKNIKGRDLNQRQVDTKQLEHNLKLSGNSTLVDEQIEYAIGVSLLKIEPFSFDNLEPASYDLTVGEVVHNGVAVDEEVLAGSEGVIVEAGDRLAIRTRERIQLSKHIVGHLGGMTSLTRLGAFYSVAAQVDPTFEGSLVVSIWNQGHINFPLKFGQKFLTLELSYLAIPPRERRGKAEVKLDDYSASTKTEDIDVPVSSTLEDKMLELINNYKRQGK